MATKALGQKQQYLLSEIFHAGGWVVVNSQVCGSNYGGRKKHETMVSALQDRGLLEVKEEDGELMVRATDKAESFI